MFKLNSLYVFVPPKSYFTHPVVLKVAAMAQGGQIDVAGLCGNT